MHHVMQQGFKEGAQWRAKERCYWASLEGAGSTRSPARLPTASLDDVDGLAFFRGCLYALPISICLWAIILLLVLVL
jgi:hypothetical protein